MSYYGLSDGNSINTLFSFGTPSTSNSNSTFLSDYAAIRNGSYYKLLDVYYNGNEKTGPVGEDTTATSSDSAKKLTSLQESADALKNTLDELFTTGKKSVFNEKEIKQEDGTTKKGYDVDAIYKKVNKFVEEYNALMKSSKDVSSDTVTKAVNNLKNSVGANQRLLSKIGIEISNDGTLKLDEKTFKEGNMGRVKDVFNGIGSFGYQISARVSMIDYSAQREAAKSNTYNKYGNYSNNYNYSYNSYI